MGLLPPGIVLPLISTMVYASNNLHMPTYRLFRRIAKLLLGTRFRIKPFGVHTLPGQGPLVFVPKHQRWEDIPIIGLTAPRALYYMAKFELFRNPFIGLLLSALGGIPINRNRPVESRQSLKKMLAMLKEGQAVVIFAEGTYYPNKMGKGYSGLLHMITSRHQVPIVPVGIQYLPALPRIRTVVHYGNPLLRATAESPQALLERILVEVGRLSNLDYSTTT